LTKGLFSSILKGEIFQQTAGAEESQDILSARPDGTAFETVEKKL
jgi:hypothetical protein